MRIDWIRIKGFRNFVDEKINFANQTLIIGANDVGKTNLIYSLRILFDRGLSDKDLELHNSDYNVYTKTESIEITVKVTEVNEDCLISTFKGDIKDGTVFIQYKNTKTGEFQILTGHSEVASTKPVMVYASLPKVNRPVPHANIGITICSTKNEKINGFGCLVISFKEVKLELRLPENVIKTNSHGIMLVKSFKKLAKKTPRITLVGVIKGIMLSSCLFNFCSINLITPLIKVIFSSKIKKKRKRLDKAFPLQIYYGCINFLFLTPFSQSQKP